jgi:hypothetical protein
MYIRHRTVRLNPIHGTFVPKLAIDLLHSFGLYRYTHMGMVDAMIIDDFLNDRCGIWMLRERALDRHHTIILSGLARECNRAYQLARCVDELDILLEENSSFKILHFYQPKLLLLSLSLPCFLRQGKLKTRAMPGNLTIFEKAACWIEAAIGPLLAKGRRRFEGKVMLMEKVTGSLLVHTFLH